MVGLARSPLRRAIIVGGGPGGLAAAAALRRAGCEVMVCERAASSGGVGSGLTLWPNASAALDRLGLLPSLAAICLPMSSVDMRNWDGRVLFEAALAEVQGQERFLSVGLSRTELVDMLSAPVADAVLLNARVIDVEQQADVVHAYLADGRRLSADILIAADGLHSVIRSRYVVPNPLRYAGYTVWRGIANAGLKHRVGTTWMGPGRQFGLFPLARERAYWFASLKANRGEFSESDGMRAVLAKHFGEGPEPIADMVDATDDAAIVRTDIFERPLLATWIFGRVVLLGDAAHPAAPTLGQGACQAIEDGVALGACLAGADDAKTGLRQYEAHRLKRANALVRQAQQAGKLGLWENSLACRVRDLMIGGMPAAIHRRHMKSLFAFRAAD